MVWVKYRRFLTGGARLFLLLDEVNCKFDEPHKIGDFHDDF